MTDVGQSLFVGADAPVVLRTTSDALPGVEMPKPRRQCKTPRPDRELQPGDPACWAWPPFAFGRGLGVDAGMRAFRAWHKKRCGICGDVPRLLVTDHDHNTALVRGLLCDECNKAEGVVHEKDDVFARWRAVPSAAILGIEIVYVSSHTGVADAMPLKVTGPPYLPDWAPQHYPWPPKSALRTELRPGSAGRPSREPDTSAWPVQLGEWVALGLREHAHGIAECRVGQVDEIGQFGVRLRSTGRWGAITVRWEAIEEICHGESESCPDINSFRYRWMESLPQAMEVRRQENERRIERRQRQSGQNVPGYL